MAKNKTNSTSSSEEYLLSSWSDLRADWQKTGMVTLLVLMVLFGVFYWLRVG